MYLITVTLLHKMSYQLPKRPLSIYVRDWVHVSYPDNRVTGKQIDYDCPFVLPTTRLSATGDGKLRNLSFCQFSSQSCTTGAT
jgi:hypothetical protein